MPSKADVRAEATRLRHLFEDAGALSVETDILQSADILLDLYGEDIRARAFVTHDPLSGEQMLRPDFTVPIVQMHMADGAEPARYTYAGEVFRRQEQDEGRASEYLQVGYEVFDRSDPAASDAEVFSTFAKFLQPLGLTPATGDIGILTAAVRGLKTTERRKSALLRHIWRPVRFRALLDRFSGRVAVPDSRLDLLANSDPMSGVGTLVGLRSRDEIDQRIAALRADMAAPPISGAEVQMLDEILGLQAKSPDALNKLRSYCRDMPAIVPSVDGMELRLRALDRLGVDVDELGFEASYGRTSMEYYDGFVFGFYDRDQPDMQPVATGGRYDALTRVLGGGRSIPAVGGVVRPDLLLQVKGAQP